MNFKVSAKLGQGKWWTFGTIKKNQWGNLQLSMKNTQQLKDFVNNGGDWLNFALFEEDTEKQTAMPSQSEVYRDAQSVHRSQPDIDDEIPF